MRKRLLIISIVFYSLGCDQDKTTSIQDKINDAKPIIRVTVINGNYTIYDKQYNNFVTAYAKGDFLVIEKSPSDKLYYDLSNVAGLEIYPYIYPYIVGNSVDLYY